MFESWMLTAIEEEGYTDTSEGLINRVAKVISESSSDTIDSDEFRAVCIKCNVDPDSFSSRDLYKLEDKLKNL